MAMLVTAILSQISRLSERGELLVPHPALAQGGQGAGVAFTGDHRLDDRAGGLVPGQPGDHRGQLAKSVLEQLLQPLPVPGAVRGQVPDVPGTGPQRPDLRRRHERGPQHPHLGQPRVPLDLRAVSGVGGSLGVRVDGVMPLGGPRQAPCAPRPVGTPGAVSLAARPSCPVPRRTEVT
jgi:hypothetical protein